MASQDDPNQLIAEDKLKSISDQDFYKTLNQDLRTNIQMGPAVEGSGQGDMWLLDIFFHGLSKRKGLGKVLYILVFLAILFGVGYGIRLLLS